jgi:O-antigen ligase
MTAAFLEATVHSHNGYLEMLATTGIPGLTLALIAALVVPLFQFLSAPRPNNIRLFSLLFSLWLYGLLENLMETQLYTRDREVWIVFVTTILVVNIKSKYSEDKKYTSNGRISGYKIRNV